MPCWRTSRRRQRWTELNTVYVTEHRPDDFLSKLSGALGAKPGDAVCFGHTNLPWQRGSAVCE